MQWWFFFVTLTDTRTTVKCASERARFPHTSQGRDPATGTTFLHTQWIIERPERLLIKANTAWAEEARLTSETNSIQTNTSHSDHNTPDSEGSKSKCRRCLFSAPVLLSACLSLLSQFYSITISVVAIHCHTFLSVLRVVSVPVSSVSLAMCVCICVRVCTQALSSAGLRLSSGRCVLHTLVNITLP